MKWAAPFSRGLSWREPTPTKKPRAADWAPGTSWVSSRAPLGRVIGWYIAASCKFFLGPRPAGRESFRLWESIPQNAGRVHRRNAFPLQ